MSIRFCRLSFITLMTLGLASATVTANAQTYPTKPVRIIVPVGAGGATDSVVNSPDVAALDQLLIDTQGSWARSWRG